MRTVAGAAQYHTVPGVHCLNEAPSNLPASVRTAIVELASQSKLDFGLLLTKYALERLLYRLSVSKHRDAFVLKGSLLFKLWTSDRRPDSYHHVRF